MNRRHFFQSSAVGLGALFALPLMAQMRPSLPVTWRDFDWVLSPFEKAFRLENRGGNLHLASLPFSVTTTTLTYTSAADVDWTKETLEVIFPCPITGKHILKQVVYTNEMLLTEAKERGFTHLQGFASVMYVKDDLTPARRCYAVRGAKLPDWAKINGKLRVVKV